MNNIKRSFLSLAIVSSVLLATGCANNLAMTRAVTRTVVSTGAAIGIQKAPTAKPYLQAARPIICSLSEGTNIAPVQVVSALTQADIDQLKTPEGLLILNGALALYTGLYESYGSKAKNVPELQAVLGGTCDGLGDALGTASAAFAAKPHLR